MPYDDEQREDEYRSYRWWSTVFAILTVVGALAAVGLAISLLLGRSWYEGAVVGSVAGALMVHLQASNAQFRQYWEDRSREDFEDEERTLAAAWKREQRRPDDEYVGW